MDVDDKPRDTDSNQKYEYTRITKKKGVPVEVKVGTTQYPRLKEIKHLIVTVLTNGAYTYEKGRQAHISWGNVTHITDNTPGIARIGEEKLTKKQEGMPRKDDSSKKEHTTPEEPADLPNEAKSLKEPIETQSPEEPILANDTHSSEDFLSPRVSDNIEEMLDQIEESQSLGEDTYSPDIQSFEESIEDMLKDIENILKNRQEIPSDKPVKPPARTVAELIDHGNMSSEKAENILSNKPNGAFFIRNTEDGTSKYLVLKDHNGITRQLPLDKDVYKESQTIDDLIYKHDKSLTKPVLADNLIQKKSEAVNLICQKIFTQMNYSIQPALKIQIETEMANIKHGGTHTFEIGEHKFHVARDKDTKAIEISKISKFIAAGGFGTVYSVEGLNTESWEVVKMAKDTPEAKFDVLNEIKMLRLLNPDGQAVGIQIAPHTIIYYVKNGIDQVGHMGIRYAGDGADLCSNPANFKGPLDRYNGTLQLLNALLILKKHKVYHRDIKINNTLFKWDENGNLILSLSDFGGARTSDTLKKDFMKDFLNPNVDWGTIAGSFFESCTPPYVSSQAKLAIENKIEKMKDLHAINPLSEQEISEFFENEIMPELFRNDAFALGLSLFTYWTAKVPPLLAFKIGMIPGGFGEKDIKAKIVAMHAGLTAAGAPVNVTTAIMKLIGHGLV